MKTSSLRFFVPCLLLAASLPAWAAGLRVDNAPNIEDMLTTPDGQWVIGSGMAVTDSQPGALYAINIKSKSVQRLYQGNSDASAKTTDSGCPGELAAGNFAPHGISLHQSASGDWSLYVVNHGGRESVEAFSLTINATTNQPELAWSDCIVLPPGTMANSVAVATDGTVYITASGNFFAAAENEKSATSEPVFPPGGILAWNSASGWREIPGGKMIQPNGLLVSADNRHLYAADWSGKTVFEIDLNDPEATRTLLLDFMPDNLRWDSDGSFWVAGHTAEPQSIFECYLSAASQCPVDWGLARVDSQSMTSMCQELLPATQTISTITVAQPVADTLWLGTFRGPAIHISDKATKSNAATCIQPPDAVR